MDERPVILPASEQDLQNAYDWYEEREPGVGERFLSRAASAFRRIQLNPDRYPVKIGRFRRSQIEIFPYSIFYTIENGRVFIHAIYHHSRNPEALKRRLRKSL